jgi:hypothetical protein
LRFRIVLQVDGDRGGQVAARGISAHRDPGGIGAQLGGVVEGPFGGGQRIVVAGRERVLGGEAVVHRQHADAGLVASRRRGRRGSRVADDEAAAVEIDQQAGGVGRPGGV